MKWTLTRKVRMVYCPTKGIKKVQMEAFKDKAAIRQQKIEEQQ